MILGWQAVTIPPVAAKALTLKNSLLDKMATIYPIVIFVGCQAGEIGFCRSLYFTPEFGPHAKMGFCEQYQKTMNQFQNYLLSSFLNFYPVARLWVIQDLLCHSELDSESI